MRTVTEVSIEEFDRIAAECQEKAQQANDKQDAQRFRWLADALWTCELNQFSGPKNKQYLWGTTFSAPYHNENASLAAAIDAAMAENQG